MIKLKSALNYKGDIVSAGTVISLGDHEKTLIEKGVAESITKEEAAEFEEEVKRSNESKKKGK